MANKHYDQVCEFMELMGQQIIDEPTEPTPGLAILRYNLIEEEVTELADAMADDDYVEIADALTDILYVTYGASAAFGVNTKYTLVGGTKEERSLPTISTSIEINEAYKQRLDGLTSAYRAGCPFMMQRTLDSFVHITYVYAARLGIDIYACFDEVHASNLSKVCATREHAEESIRLRKADPATSAKYNNTSVKQVGTKFAIVNDSGKILKGMDYFEPDLKKILHK